MKKWSVTADKFLTLEEISRVINYLEDRKDLATTRGKNRIAIIEYYVLRALLEIGARAFEFCALKNGDFEGQRLNLRVTKGNRPRTVLLTRSGMNLLREWMLTKERLGFDCSVDQALFPNRTGRHYSRRGILYLVKRVFKGAGIRPQLGVHSLRHSNASLLLSTGKVDLVRVRDNLGHTSLTTTNLYAHAVSTLEDVDLSQFYKIRDKSKQKRSTFVPKENNRGGRSGK